MAPALAGWRLSRISSYSDWYVSLRNNYRFHFLVYSLGWNSDRKLGLCMVLCRTHWQLKAELIVPGCSPVGRGKDTVTSVALYAKLLPKKVSRLACTAPDNFTFHLLWPESVGVITAPIFLSSVPLQTCLLGCLWSGCWHWQWTLTLPQPWRWKQYINFEISVTLVDGHTITHIYIYCNSWKGQNSGTRRDCHCESKSWVNPCPWQRICTQQ